MDVIYVTVALNDGTLTSEVRVDVSVVGSAFTRADGGDLPRIELPASPRPLPLVIRVTPTNENHWSVPDASFEYRSPGALVPVGGLPPDYAPPRGVSVDGSGAVSLVVTLSRVRDATVEVMTSLAAVPSIRVGHHPTAWPPPSWGTPALGDHRYVSYPPVSSGSLGLDTRTVDPDTTDVVLEVKNVVAPRFIAVSWPNAVALDPEAMPTPMVVYFHANVTQNVPDYYAATPTYPLGWDFVYYGLWRYLNYMGDPIRDDPFAKGLPYQVSASGKDVVLILPSHAISHEVGVFMSAASMEAILKEIQGFMFRRAGAHQVPPPLGRVALASFSAGNGLVAKFLASSDNRSHPFYLDTLREVYMFDAPKVTNWVNQVAHWAGAGTTADKMARAYTRKDKSAFDSLLGRTRTSSPSFTDSADSLRTAGIVTPASWAAADPTAWTDWLALGVAPWQLAHQMISATLLTDALRRSAF